MHRFDQPLHQGRLIKRYKRFLADIELSSGELITAHCANTGPMTGCAEPGSAVLLTKSDNPARKLQYSLELIKVGRTWVGINTARPNAIVEDAIVSGAVKELKGYEGLRREVKYGRGGKSRIDILLEDEKHGRCWVEVKNTTLLTEPGMARFPDAVTTRGQKHLQELTDMAKAGDRAVIFFLVNRADAARMGPADEIDPVYGKLLRKALKAGVEALAYQVKNTKRGAQITGRLPVVLD
ncbi:MAG: DNA/RNA nuclease SfsA [Chrysiogenetes bacterium]|nr:DNA/RNA nuclease SfsA [Chrysiogenetes bacterium]